MAAVRSCWALLLGIALMMLGNGLQGSLLGIRAALEGFATTATGIVMSGYFAGFLAGAGAFAACGAVLLGALSFGGWPRVWTLFVAAWVGIFAIGALRAPGQVVFALAFPLWLLAAWWIGRQQPLARHGGRTAPHTLISNPTKFGWQAAVHAMPTPVIVARDHRVIDVNAAACEFIGRSERTIVGNLGFEAASAESTLEAQTQLLEHLETQRQQVSGVNVDEEMVNLVAQQQAFEAASRFINVVSELTQTVINLGAR